MKPDNQPGIKHAPGTMCIVNVQDSWAPKYNNRKIVTLIRSVAANTKYRCECGAAGLLQNFNNPYWEVAGDSLRCVGARNHSKLLMLQRWLIPIGNPRIVTYETHRQQVPKTDVVRAVRAYKFDEL